MTFGTRPASPATDAPNQMFPKLLTSAIGAGAVAWLLAAVLHFAFVQNLILLGEEYETGALVHYGAGGATVSHDDGAGHSHAEGEAADGHDHGHSGEGSALTRDLWTAVFFGLVYVAYAMILVAGFAVARAYGKVITAREGLIWGVAGFAAFQLAPAMGLPPELPGTIAADLGARQVWWWGTVLATAGGFALFAYGRGFAAGLAGAVLIGLPHLIGAPLPDGFSGTAPPEVAAAFASNVLGCALAVWALMGLAAGHLWASTADKPA